MIHPIAALRSLLQRNEDATQQESTRVGRELVRVGATLEGVQGAIADLSAVVERLEFDLSREQKAAQEREDRLRQEVWSATLGSELATLDGLEAGIREARTLAQSLSELGRQLDDPVVRRWWRAFAEVTGIERPLPEFPASDVENWVRGLEVTYRRLNDVLERQGVIAIEASGRPFDPNLHEAVAVEECPIDQDNLVLREEQRGYRTAERILRHAQVVVGQFRRSSEGGDASTDLAFSFDAGDKGSQYRESSHEVRNE